MRAHRASLADVIPFSWVDGPGNRYVIFLQGCNFNCLACHNPQTIPLQSAHATPCTVDEVVAGIRTSMPYISGVTASGGEATLQHEFLVDLFSAVKGDEQLAGLTTFIDSNGSASRQVWEELAPVTDGVMLDLKALDGDRHRELTGQSNDAVLASIRQLSAMRLLHEVRLLLAPGRNDSDAELRATARWLLGVDPGMRVKINAFRPHGVRAPARDWPETGADDLARYRSTLIDEGIVTVL